MKCCPKCGNAGGWYANCRAYGYAQQQGGWEDALRETYETITDDINWRDTKYVICEKCSARILRSLLITKDSKEST